MARPAKRPTDKSSGTVNRISREIGLQLRARRNELGLTQTSLAEQVGVSQQQVNKYEQGFGRIPAEQLMKLCRLLRLEPSALFRPLDAIGVEPSGFAEPESLPFIVEAFADRDTVTLVRAFQSIADKTVRKKVLDLVAALTDGSGKQASTARRRATKVL